MIDQQFSEIIEKLIQGTRLKKIKWEKAQRETEFMVKLGSSMVSTDNWILENGNQCVDLTLWNSNGEIAKRIAFENNTEEAKDYGKLMELYALVKNAYYQVSETIAEVLGHLEFK